MNWEQRTTPESGREVNTCRGICVFPLGVLEKHDDHLLLGQASEARHHPGAVAIRSERMLSRLKGLFDETARPGVEKINIVNGRGNEHTGEKETSCLLGCSQNWSEREMWGDLTCQRNGMRA
jgi:creatinine amidohydrolase/Fe(II)-dependent formamide hydrolase-like protein